MLIQRIRELNKDIVIDLKYKSRENQNNILLESKIATLYISKDYDFYWYDLENIQIDLYVNQVLKQTEDDYIFLKVMISNIDCFVKNEGNWDGLSTDLDNFSTFSN